LTLGTTNLALTEVPIVVDNSAEAGARTPVSFAANRCISEHDVPLPMAYISTLALVHTNIRLTPLAYRISISLASMIYPSSHG